MALRCRERAPSTTSGPDSRTAANLTRGRHQSQFRAAPRPLLRASMVPRVRKSSTWALSRPKLTAVGNRLVKGQVAPSRCPDVFGIGSRRDLRSCGLTLSTPSSHDQPGRLCSLTEGPDPSQHFEQAACLYGDITVE